MPDMSNISDEQLQFSLNMMKQNPDMFKNMMKSQGMDMSDEQLNMMTNMMTPEMMRMAGNMSKSGMMPPNMGTTAGSTPSATSGSASAPQNPFGSGGFPNMNMSGDQSDQMKNMASEMFNNPDMLINMIKMLKSNPNNPMTEMLKQQFPNASPGMLSSAVSALSWFILAYAYMKKVWSYTITKILFFCFCVYVVAWFIK